MKRSSAALIFQLSQSSQYHWRRTISLFSLVDIVDLLATALLTAMIHLGQASLVSAQLLLEYTGERLRGQRRLFCRHVPCRNSKTAGMIAPGCATRLARWLAANGVVDCGRLQPTSLRRGLFFEPNRQSLRPLRTRLRKRGRD